MNKEEMQSEAGVLVCKHCGTEFTPATTGRKPEYCSSVCRTKAFRHRTRVAGESKYQTQETMDL